jgi:hypothetical protein
MEQINKKIERYIILSKKFQKSTEGIFGEKYSTHNVASAYWVSNPSFIDGRVQTETVIEKTRAEKILEEAKLKADLANEYDEYLKLQKDLGEYFTSLNKLVNN